MNILNIRKLAAIFTVLILSLECHISEASPIKFVSTIPANGSEISTFDIKLQFDITENIKEQGTDEVGVGFMGFYDESDPDWNYATLLYEGTPENGKLIAVTLDTNFKGTSQSKDIIDLNFSSALVPEAGKTYTVVCNNSFPLYDLTTGKTIKGGTLNWQTDPKVFTFIGVIPSSSELIFHKSSITENSSLSSINSISFEFNEEIAVAQDKPVQILDENEQIASSKSVKVDPANGKSLIATFDDVTLYLGKQYTISLPAGVVSLKSNSSVLNKPVEITVNGTSTIRLSTKSVNPANNSIALPESAEIRFNLEPGQTLTPPFPEIIHKKEIDFYKSEISESTLISKISGTANEDGITWDLSEFRFEPETRYILHKKADDITVWVDRNIQPAYGNEEVIISFTTPSVEEAGFPPMEFENPLIRGLNSLTNTDYTPSMEIPYLGVLGLDLKDQYYYIGSKTYELYTHPDAQDCLLYEINDDGDRLIKSLSLQYYPAEDKYRVWKRANAPIETYLYEGKKYKFIIPEGYFTVSPPVKEHGDKINISKCNYIKNKELVYTFTGTTPAECILLDCNIVDNSTVSSLYNVIWTFEGDYHLSDDVTTVAYQKNSVSGPSVAPVEIPVKVTKFDGGVKTAVMADFVSEISGNPTSLIKGTSYTITVPKGLIVNSSNEDIVNDEIVLTIIGGAEDPAEARVKVNINVEGVHAYSHDASKGSDYSFSVVPAPNWEVESVTSGGKALASVAEETASTTPIYQLTNLRMDKDVNISYRYTGEWAQQDETTGIWNVPGSEVRIYRDGENIVVEGVSAANSINLYTVGGMLVETTRVSEGNNRVRIMVSPGQYYIVMVDGVASKLKM